MELSERKKKVLRSVVDLYIRTAEPVGSKAVTELPDMKYSSATIRNEMAELTALGYLEQPHTSAGRIPSASGYRLYVDELMMDYRLSIDETKSINTAIEEKMQRVDKLVEKVAKLVSQATDLPAISAASRSRSVTVKRYDLILAAKGSVIAVLMLSNEQVVNKLIKLPLERMTFSICSEVICSGGMSVREAFSTAASSLRSLSDASSGSLISLLTTCSLESISTAMTLPGPAKIKSYRLTLRLRLREAAEIAGRSVA